MEKFLIYIAIDGIIPLAKSPIHRLYNRLIINKHADRAGFI